MCHLNFDNLVTIRKNRRARGIKNLKKIEMAIWKQCQIGKMGKTSFKRKNYNIVEFFQLVHINLCGPIGTKSHIGDKNFFLFLDDYYRMMIVMYLRDKSKSFEMFKLHLTRVEKEIGNNFKCLWLDRGGEVISNEFNKFYN